MDDDPREERFRVLYDSNRSRLLSYAVRRTQSPEDAVDVVAEVFAIAWRRLDNVPVDESSVLWLYATARRVIANETRRRRTRSQVMDRLRNAARSVSMSESNHEDAMVAASVLAQLSEDDREVLMLTAWEGLSTADLACVLGCSMVAARIRVHRARKRLSNVAAAEENSSRQIPDLQDARPRTPTPSAAEEV